MKKISALLLLVIFAASSYVEICAFDDDETEIPPDIEPFEIIAETINNTLHDTGHTPLFEDFGYVIIPNTFYKHDGTSDGIIVTRSIAGGYAAFEIKCPRCKYDFHQHGKIYFPERSSMAICNKCGARMESLLFHSSGQLFYNCGADSPRYLIEYQTDIYRKGNQTHIRIDKSNY